MIEFNNAEHGKRIAQAIPRMYNQAVDPVISHTRDGELLGGVIFDGYTGNCIFVHQAGFDKSWLSREMLSVVFDYAFNQLKVGKVCGTIPSNNADLLAFNSRLGFSLEATIKDAYPDGDLLILSMTRAQCQWLKRKPRAYERRGQPTT